MTMANTQEATARDLDKLKDFTSAAMQGLTTEMVGTLVEKLVQAIELLDEVAQPETIELLRQLPAMSGSLQRSMELIQRVEQNGTLQSLIELGEMVGTMRVSMTTPMVADMVEKGIKGIEMADEVSQQLLPLLEPMNEALTKTTEEPIAKQPPSKLQLLRATSDPDVRIGLNFLLTFTKNLGEALRTAR